MSNVKEENVEKLRNALVEIASKDDLARYLKNEKLNEKYENIVIKNKILSLSK